MKAEALLELYERVADAPEAIPRLRRFVLDLAVRGKLVKQDAGDEPATSALARITAVRESVPMTARKSVSRQVPDSISNLGFELPSAWLQVPLSELVRVLNGRAYKRTELLDQGKTKVLRVGNLFTSDHWYFSDLDLEADKYCGPGDLIYAWSASFGPFIWTGPRVIYHYHIWKLDLFSEADTCKQFLHLYLQQKTREIKDSGHGISMVHMTKEKMERLAVPLPPLSEQHRIVAKVDELMALLDRLDAARSTREATRDRLTTASLTRLTAADTDPEALRTYARFALDALPALTTHTDQVKQLRQAILDLAVRGKLVKREAADEPATKLLLRIEAQRSSLGLPPTQAASKNSEAPFQLPSGWRFTRLGDLCSKTGSGSTPRGGKEVYRSSGVAFLRSQNVHNDGVRLDDVAYIDYQTHQRMSGTQVLPGDLLLNITGGSIGRCARVPHDFCDANLSQHVAIIRPAEPDIQRFLHWLILSPYFQSFVMDEQTGAGRGGLPKNRMDRILVPVPPLAEQHRIVAKVDELMALCDRLEAALQSADRTRASLLEALLHEALDSRADNLIDFAEARTRLRPTRSGVGSLIVHHQARRGQGGRIKLGKSLYFAEAHCGIALGGSFGRANFGPHDEWIYTFEREACHASWFSVSERPLGDGKLRAEYTPGPALAAKADDARADLGEYAAELERVLDLLAPLTAEEAEIAATLFAAWNDLLIEGGAVTDEFVITEVREHWHPSKARFTPEVLKQWLGWLRRNGLVPRGRGPSTRQQGRLI